MVTKTKANPHKGIAREKSKPKDLVPQKIFVIYWYLDTTEGTCKIDFGTSGWCDISVIGANGLYQDIYSFTAAVSSGASVPLNRPLPVNPDSHPQPWDFAIDVSCYVVFVLEQQLNEPAWQFHSGIAGIDFKHNQSGWYTAPVHVTPNGPSPVASSTSKGLYFSGYVDPSEGPGNDAYTIHFNFWLGVNFYVENFDPAIKNKGHRHFLPHVPKPFRLRRDKFKTTSATTRRLMAS